MSHEELLLISLVIGVPRDNAASDSVAGTLNKLPGTGHASVQYRPSRQKSGNPALD